MATINYTADHDVAGGAVRVEWAGLSAGDQGQVFECAGLKLASIQYSGSFGGNVAVHASNEPTPTNFSQIHDVTSADMQLTVENVSGPYVGAVKPVAGGGVSAANVAILFVKA